MHAKWKCFTEDMDIDDLQKYEAEERSSEHFHDEEKDHVS